MRVVVTGGAGFIGRAVVDRLAERGDQVVALVRDPLRARHLVRPNVELVQSDLSDPVALARAFDGADAAIHGAGDYRIGIRASEKAAMWDANVETTRRVLTATTAAGAARVLYLSTLGVMGNTRGRLVDETYRRDLAEGFLSYYDETKYRAHEVAEARIADGAPVVIAMPSQVYGPNDHSLTSRQLELAHAGKLRYVALGSSGVAWVHVHDLADGIVAALDRGRIGEGYLLAGECRRLDEAIAIAARVGGHRPPAIRLPTALLRLAAPINDAVGGLPGMPGNLGETISSGAGVTYWGTHEKAARELGFAPRTLAQGIADTWGATPAGPLKPS